MRPRRTRPPTFRHASGLCLALTCQLRYAPPPRAACTVHACSARPVTSTVADSLGRVRPHLVVVCPACPCMGRPVRPWSETSRLPARSAPCGAIGLRPQHGMTGMAGFNKPPAARPATGYVWVAYRGAASRTSAPVPRPLDEQPHSSVEHYLGGPHAAAAPPAACAIPPLTSAVTGNLGRGMRHPRRHRPRPLLTSRRVPYAIRCTACPRDPRPVARSACPVARNARNGRV